MQQGVTLGLALEGLAIQADGSLPDEMKS
jgi:hypothetical protein